MPQSFTCLHCHIVFSTKERQALIGADIRDRLYKYIGGILKLKENKSKLMAVGGMPDHIHLLVSLSKELSVAAALRLIKTNSSKWVHETFPEHREHRSFSWQAGYGALAVSLSQVGKVQRYIRNQAAHHRRADATKSNLMRGISGNDGTKPAQPRQGRNPAGWRLGPVSSPGACAPGY